MTAEQFAAKVKAELGDHKHDHPTVEMSLASEVEAVQNFWEQRDSLRRIHAIAQARMVGPWGVLGAVLVRVMCAVPAQVRLPATIGAPMSLNLFVALVGVSGEGKDGCIGCARDAVRFTDQIRELRELPLGSGEGIARALERDDDGNQDPVLFKGSEIDTVAALFSRRDSTLEPELRKLYCGDQLGFTNAQKHTRSLVSAHSYRAGMIVGVQPRRGDALLRGSDGGTPQRFLWMPVHDMSAPDVTPTMPAAWAVTLPPMFTPEMQMDDTGYGVDLDYPEEVRTEIEEQRRKVLRREPGIDPLDGHALMCRLKVAAALMFLDGGRTVVDVEDWDLAGHVMKVSDRTRRTVTAATADRAATTNRARAAARDEEDQYLSESKHKRAREAIVRLLGRVDGDTVSRSDLRRLLKVEVRVCFDPAISELINEGLVVAEKVDGGTAYKGCGVSQ